MQLMSSNAHVEGLIPHRGLTKPVHCAVDGGVVYPASSCLLRRVQLNPQDRASPPAGFVQSGVSHAAPPAGHSREDD